METLLVRLKPYDPRRGHVLRRFTYRGIKFQDDRGWYRVKKEVADYLRKVRQIPSDEHAPLAFDVCTPAEAKAMDAKEQDAASTRKSATDNIKLSEARRESTPSSDDAEDDEDAPDKQAQRKARGK